jgi:hypothetical protein
MAQYGQVHRVSDFVRQTIGKREAPFAQKVIALLAQLDQVQQANPLVTLGVQTGGALRILYKGQQILSLYPSTRRLRLYITHSNPWLTTKLKTAAKRGLARKVRVRTNKSHYDYWFLEESVFTLVAKAVIRLNANIRRVTVVGDHPRTFPGAEREAALQLFFAGGSICPGVHRKPHKLGDLDRKVFDHILPYSKGGASNSLSAASGLASRASQAPLCGIPPRSGGVRAALQ